MQPRELKAPAILSSEARLLKRARIHSGLSGTATAQWRLRFIRKLRAHPASRYGELLNKNPVSSPRRRSSTQQAKDSVDQVTITLKDAKGKAAFSVQWGTDVLTGTFDVK